MANKEDTLQNQQQIIRGELPPDFLRFNVSRQDQQVAADEQAAQMLQAQYAGYTTTPIAAPIAQNRISVTIVEAALVKNYGLTKMDLYCRLRIGHSVFETHTNNSAGKNPRWNKTVHCLVPQGVDSMFIEIFEERTFFSTDDKVAWAHVLIPERVTVSGDTIDDWYPLSGKQGEKKEGNIKLVISKTQNPNVMPYPPAPQLMVIPQGGYFPPQIGIQTHQQVIRGVPQQHPQQQQQVGPLYTEEDIKQLKDMFPGVDEDVVKSVLHANQGNKDRAINDLLQMSQTN
ncbi:DgyrCDS12481 [Dimorphilus gyrociliatus]|uniref:DgyrCDS12481 n=1 Tax=Dimorphilus gyrociliatus TaxID=2664684 RepID=A0A7I8W6M3_9ANNE|nr:DgyrCDS12481 [Dimorphilus gyrociliatus]